MSALGIFEWETEQSLSCYPLTYAANLVGTTKIPDDLLRFASFLQFDGFVPVLKKITVSSTAIVLTIQFDLVEKEITFDATDALSTVRIYDNDNANRFLGTLTFGDSSAISGLMLLFPSETVFDVNVPFVSSTVTAIPTSAGVFSVHNLFRDESNAGVIQLNFLDNLFFVEVSGSPTTVSLNAVAQGLDAPYLKSINYVSPQDGNIFFTDSFFIKINANPAIHALEFTTAATDVSIQPTSL